MIYALWGVVIIILYVIVTLAVIIVPCLILKLLRMEKALDAVVYYCMGNIASFALFLCGVKVNVSGDLDSIKMRIAQGEGFCFISNHTSILDVMLIIGKLRIKAGFVTKKEIAYIPFINIVIVLIHSVLMDRNSLKKSVKSIHRATKNIKKGISMLIFPEGTRSKTGEIAPFKHGSFRLATESGARLVPITIKGLRPSFEQRKHIFQRSECYLHIGDPIDVPKASEREAVNEMIKKIEGDIRSTYEKLG